ncbi:hypothetical protein NON20_24375 (plasmid) [Synechocystis sp. B12]|nr:hypothetical protein NON20_24375 [Synechocystis sp. B12]
MINQAIQLAQLFGDLLTMADYSMAYALLSPELQRQYPPQILRQTVETMIDYGSGAHRQGDRYAGMSLKGVAISPHGTQ